MTVNGRRRLYRNTPELRARVRELMDEFGATNAHNVARLSRGRLRFQTVHNLITGTVESVQVSTLERLADTLRTSFDELAELCQKPEAGPWVLPARFDSVPLDVRRAWERASWTLFVAAGVVQDVTVSGVIPDIGA